MVFSEDNLGPGQLVSALEFVSGKSIDPHKDLLVFDEIQACPGALTALKYFSQDMPRAFVCAAGSLLGVSLGSESFPVGNVDILDVNPMNLDEFLLGIGEEQARGILAGLNFDSHIEDYVHSRLWQLLGEYISVGGMPEAVERYRLERSDSIFTGLREAREVLNHLVIGYFADVAKHSGKQNAMHIERVLRDIPAQLGREVNGNAARYRFKGVIPGKRGYRDLARPIDWLEKAGIIMKVPVVNRGEQPLSAWEKPGVFKLYLHDIGVLSSLSGIPLIERGGFLKGTYKGWVGENYVAQEFVASGMKRLYGWTGRTAEVEFVLSAGSSSIPVEVKVGTRTQSKSATVFAEKYSSPLIVKLGNWPVFRRKGMLHLPLYAAGMLAQKTLTGGLSA